MNKVIAIIPARGGSKRLIDKNIRLLGNLPLLAYSILFAKKHDFIDEVYVSTDYSQIKDIALQYGAKVIDRPTELSGDTEPTVTVLKHAVNEIKAHPDDTIILLQATNPLRPHDLLNLAYKEYILKNANCLFTVSRDEHKLGKIINSIFVPFNYTIGQRSQDLEPLFYENGLLYINKANLIQDLAMIAPDALPYIINHPFAKVDIDTIDDFEYAEYLIKKHNYTI